MPNIYNAQYTKKNNTLKLLLRKNAYNIQLTCYIIIN